MDTEPPRHRAEEGHLHRVERGARGAKRNPALAAMMATVALILLTATAISTGFGIEAGRQAEAAKKSAARSKARLRPLIKKERRTRVTQIRRNSKSVRK